MLHSDSIDIERNRPMSPDFAVQLWCVTGCKQTKSPYSPRGKTCRRLIRSADILLGSAHGFQGSERVRNRTSAMFIWDNSVDHPRSMGLTYWPWNRKPKRWILRRILTWWGVARRYKNWAPTRAHGQITWLVEPTKWIKMGFFNEYVMGI